jgi:hypothetical protein
MLQLVSEKIDKGLHAVAGRIPVGDRIPIDDGKQNKDGFGMTNA